MMKNGLDRNQLTD